MSQTTRDPARDASVIDELVKRVARDLQEASQKLAMLNYINDTYEFRAYFEQTYEANGLNVVYDSLINNLISILSRMYDLVSLKNSSQLNRASLNHIMALLENKAVINVFVSNARSWTPQIPSFAEKNALTAAKEIQRARVKFKNMTCKPSGREMLDELKKHRNHYISHALFDTSQNINFKYGYLHDLFQETGQIVQALRLGVAGQSWDYSDMFSVDEKMAHNFWTALEEGMIVRARNK